MAYKLIGKDFTPVDVVAKVTGRAKYAEDFRAERMAFCTGCSSPFGPSMPSMVTMLRPRTAWVKVVQE